ncbi:MAG: hypothetical protein JJLCMIEE_00217 [Acidimicrobiales bacterium]|nr:MAG: ECF transporter S component [Actinomycetota bacterium]MBV6507176.1 hypothetical protein [Acidimicrobiales bacterium]RIK05531.1 MAG: ECF transporter S component [Acidobacteriota bacterium]
MTRDRLTAGTALIYTMVGICGVAAFLYPFWLPGRALPSEAHSTTAPFVAALMATLVMLAVTVEIRQGTMSGSTVAVLAVLASSAGMLRLLDLPGGGSGIFFLVVLGGAAFGARFGILLGLSAMAVSAVLTGGIGPWLPFQMLGLGLMGALAGWVGSLTRRLPARGEVIVLAALGWVSGFLYGAVLNLWFWPFAIGEGPLSWNPGLGLTETIEHYWSFYVATSLAWDAAGALMNAVLILVTGIPVMRTLRRFSSRLLPAVHIEAPTELSLDAPVG